VVAVTDPSRLGDAFARGELPIELLVAGSLVALAIGFALTLLVGALRRRRSVPDPVPAASPENVRDSRPTLTWPIHDADAFWPAPRPSASPLAIDEPAPTPFRPDGGSAPRDAAWAEAWAAREATTEIARQTAGWASDGPADAGPETATASEPALRPAPEPLAKDAARTEAAIREDMLPSEAERYIPIARATRTNLKLCQGGKAK
jgi:hypothetical protein